MEKELIKITTNKEGQKLVSARELYEGLKFDDMDNFSRWIKKQLDNVDAVENIDFTKTLFKEGLSKTGQTKTDYILTIDIAKEICMVVGVAPRTNEETRKLSKQFRKFFIEAEKELRIIKKLDSYMIEDPIERAKRWIEEAEERKALMEENIKKDEEIKVLKPKAEFTDKFLQDDTLYKATDIAKEIGMTATKFNRLLEGLGIQFKQGGKWYITSEYDGNGYTKPYTFEYKEGKIQTQMRWSSKGRKFILDTLESLGIIK